MAWIHIKANGQVASPAFYPTEAAVDAALESGDSKLYRAPVDDIIEPGVWYDSTNQTFGLAPPATDDLNLRSDVLATHGQLLVWAQQVTAEGVAHPQAEVSIAHDFLAYAHQGIYLVAHNHRTTANAGWTLAQRRTAIQQMAFGASDITNAYEFFAAMDNAGSLIDAPTAPVLWVDVNTGQRVALAQAVATTAQMGLDSSQLPDESILSGGWINSLNA